MKTKITRATNKAGELVVYRYDYHTLCLTGINNELNEIRKHCKKSGITISDFLAPVIKKAAKNIGK